MCLKTIIGYLQGPYSSWGLNHRANILNDNSPYQHFLYTVASAIDAKVISKYDAQKAVEYFRTGKPELISVALKMIGLTEVQVIAWLKRNIDQDSISL